MKLQQKECCPIHKSLFSCGRDHVARKHRNVAGAQSIDDPHHPRVIANSGRRLKENSGRVSLGMWTCSPLVIVQERWRLLVAASLIAVIRLRGDEIKPSPKLEAVVYDSLQLAKTVLARLERS